MLHDCEAINVSVYHSSLVVLTSAGSQIKVQLTSVLKYPFPIITYLITSRKEIQTGNWVIRKPDKYRYEETRKRYVLHLCKNNKNDPIKDIKKMPQTIQALQARIENFYFNYVIGWRMNKYFFNENEISHRSDKNSHLHNWIICLLVILEFSISGGCP